jgi:hypothetical protein
MSEKGTTASVIAGLAVGIALIVLFASIFSTFDRSFADNRNKIDIAIQGLKDSYASGERISLTVHISGYSTTCDSSPRFMIINSDSGKITHRYNGIPFTLYPWESFHSVDRILTTEGPDNQLGDIVINENGNYKIIVEQYDRTVEREFSVIGSADDDSAIDSIDYITINGIFDLGIGEQNDHDYAIEMTRNLSEVKEFFDVYPTVNTRVYFITTCADESCSTLQRISSVVEYWYKADDQKYAELRVTINYHEEKPTFSQVRCSVYGTEENITQYGAVPLEGVAKFLQDSQCPET